MLLHVTENATKTIQYILSLMYDGLVDGGALVEHARERNRISIIVGTNLFPFDENQYLNTHSCTHTKESVESFVVMKMVTADDQIAEF